MALVLNMRTQALGTNSSANDDMVAALRKKAPSPALRADMKGLSAYRTISEVAAELKVASHVLRFWESKFTQIQPLKKSGGRRYYKGEDVELLRHIKALLYDQGMTIRGVQAQLGKLKKGEVKNVAAMTLGMPQVIAELEALRALLADESD